MFDRCRAVAFFIGSTGGPFPKLKDARSRSVRETQDRKKRNEDCHDVSSSEPMTSKGKSACGATHPTPLPGI